MKLYLITLTAILLLPLFSFAQSNFKPGYVVGLKGDTLKGSIDYKEWEHNPKQFTFKSSAGVLQQFTVQKSKAFAVTGFEYYEKYIVRVSQDTINATQLHSTLDTIYQVDTVFLHTMVKGRYFSLYSYRDNIKTRYYILEPGDAQPQELSYHAYIDQDASVKYVNRYRVQLENVAQKNNVNNSKLAGMLSDARYSDHDLLAIAATINGSDPKQFLSKSQFGTRFFAGAGISYNDMLFTGTIEYPDSYTVFPRVSFGMDFLNNKDVQRLYARVEIAVTGNQSSFNDSYQETQLKVTQYTASFIPQIYYNFYSTQRLKVFAGGGLAVNFSTYPTRYTVTVQGIHPAPVKQDNFPDYHTLWESLVLKAGVVLNNHVEIYAGYSPPTTITDDYVEFAGNLVTYQAGINFLFGVK